MAETIHPVSITDETRRRYLNYALSVITSRALPDVRDGLKPVQRRILYTMYHDLHLHFDGRPRKCAKIVGDVTGNYHPHGTIPAYEALVRMAQDFVMRMPLVLPQGNFGSVDGDRPAAERYTEAKLTALSDHLMSELRQRTVELRPQQGFVVPKGVLHRTRAPERTVILMVEGAGIIPTGDAEPQAREPLADVMPRS